MQELKEMSATTNPKYNIKFVKAETRTSYAQAEQELKALGMVYEFGSPLNGVVFTSDAGYGTIHRIEPRVYEFAVYDIIPE